MHQGGSQPAGASRGGNRVGRVAVWKPGAVSDSWPADRQLSAVSRREIVNCSVGPPAAPCVLRPLSAAPSLAVPRAPAAPTNECNVRGCLSPCFARDWGLPRGTLHRALDAACTCTHSPRTRSLARSLSAACGWMPCGLPAWPLAARLASPATRQQQAQLQLQRRIRRLRPLRPFASRRCRAPLQSSPGCATHSRCDT